MIINTQDLARLGQFRCDCPRPRPSIAGFKPEAVSRRLGDPRRPVNADCASCLAPLQLPGIAQQLQRLDLPLELRPEREPITLRSRQQNGVQAAGPLCEAQGNAAVCAPLRLTPGPRAINRLAVHLEPAP